MCVWGGGGHAVGWLQQQQCLFCVLADCNGGEHLCVLADCNGRQQVLLDIPFHPRKQKKRKKVGGLGWGGVCLCVCARMCAHGIAII